MTGKPERSALVTPDSPSPAVKAGFTAETFEKKSARNARVSARYDELMREGKHGHYEIMFKIVREEIERTAAPEMYEALAFQDKIMSRASPPTDSELRESTRLCRTALQRAKGGGE